MNKKILLQLLIVFIIILLSLAFFFEFLKKDEEKVIQEEIINSEAGANLIKDLEYSTIDKQGNSYVIKAKSGKVENEESEIIYMDDVKAKIVFNNNKYIFISADNAIYNGSNFNTNFEGNVVANHGEHTVNSNKLDLLFTINLAVVYDNLIYTNPFTKLLADRMEIDLITKTSKISMNDTKKKILLDYKN
jgi:hypothetical protein|tara:strand:- start:370 stop:939 length:570 start_codon:yes stop_codon:yes gene_type:complete